MNHLDAAIHIAREAGKIQLAGLNDDHQIDYKGVIDIVTEVDKRCEAVIVEFLSKEFPSYSFLAEEGSDVDTGSDYKWIIDPLDGTVNYAHGFPFFCTSIALTYKNEIISGAIYEPIRDEMFAAEKGKGATLNGKPIHVSSIDSLQYALLKTGFAYNIQEGEKRNNLDNFEKFLLKVQAVRRPGSAALDLCYVACGRGEGFWELYLKPWDMAAGIIIIQEASGKVTTFDQSTFDLYGVEILASNGHIHKDMSDTLCGRSNNGR